VESSGIYELELSSCFQFESDSFEYDTRRARPLDLKVQKFLLSGNIEGVTSVNTPVSVKIEGQKTHDNVVVSANKNGYQYTTKVSRGETLRITPQDDSGEFLFYPETQNYQTAEDPQSCLSNGPAFVMKKGHFITGKVSPAVAGVTVDVYSTEKGTDSTPLSTTTTKSDGNFRLGPLREGVSTTVVARKIGYQMEPEQLSVTTSDVIKPAQFTATQLGRIEVNIVDESSTPLPGVLVSLSGKNFRQNNITSKENLNFYSLRPNQYFLRPLLKEYTFEPATLSVALSSGQQAEASFKAKRVAFSLHGRVSSLNGMSLSDVTVEARSGDVVEESKSDEEGAF